MGNKMNTYSCFSSRSHWGRLNQTVFLLGERQGLTGPVCKSSSAPAPGLGCSLSGEPRTSVLSGEGL